MLENKFICPACGLSFTPINGNQRYCSRKCCLAKNEKDRNTKEQGVLGKQRLRKLCNNLRYRDKNSTVTTEDLLSLFEKQKGLCALTGFPLTFNSGTLSKVTTNMSVDRIDQHKGYRIDNIRLVCDQANRMRSILSDEELKQWCHAILQHLP